MLTLQWKTQSVHTIFITNYVRRTIIVGNDNSKLIPSSYKYN